VNLNKGCMKEERRKEKGERRKEKGEEKGDRRLEGEGGEGEMRG
jgi:hypothetical protein